MKTTRRIALALARTTFLFGILVWGYVIAMQLKDADLVYAAVAQWLPIRLDYFGEAAFIMSAVAYFLLKFWETKE